VNSTVVTSTTFLRCNLHNVPPFYRHSHFTTDSLFLVPISLVILSPVHICTKCEKHFFNEHLKTHPNPKDRNWNELAGLFKSKTDCKTVFPKLPSMAKGHCNHWKESQTVVLLQEKIKEKCADVPNESCKAGVGFVGWCETAEKHCPRVQGFWGTPS
jgi:hypothetical protein